jgi:nickel/cobalt transporter (NiCoT) family protein
MYPFGLLFGLSFDTATEFGLLGISAAEASKGLSIWSILLFPALVTAGMPPVDTSDGALMVGYGGIWSFITFAAENRTTLGYLVVGVFAASWLGSLVIYRAMGYDKTGSA